MTEELKNQVLLAYRKHVSNLAKEKKVENTTWKYVANIPVEAMLRTAEEFLNAKESTKKETATNTLVYGKGHIRSVPCVDSTERKRVHLRDK